MTSTANTLAAILAFTEARGFPPTTSELAEMLGLSRVASAHARVVVLEEAGFVTRAVVSVNRAARSMRVTPAGLALLHRKN